MSHFSAPTEGALLRFAFYAPNPISPKSGRQDGIPNAIRRAQAVAFSTGPARVALDCSLCPDLEMNVIPHDIHLHIGSLLFDGINQIEIVLEMLLGREKQVEAAVTWLGAERGPNHAQFEGPEGVSWWTRLSTRTSTLFVSRTHQTISAGR